MEQFKTEALLSGIEQLRAENARLKEELASLRQQQSEPVAWRYVPSSEWGEHVLTSDAERAGTAKELGCKVEPLYLAPPAQSESEMDAARYRWLRDEHNVDLPVGRISWKKDSVRNSGEWVNLIDGNDLDKHIDAAMQEGKK